MKTKMRLLVALTAVVMVGATFTLSAPAAVAETTASLNPCPNTYCYGQPWCNYWAGESCVLLPSTCDGNLGC